MAIQSNFPAIKPSLLLDFANTKQLDPRITFTRASTATYYDGVTTSKAEENLFLYSQDFDNGNWSSTGGGTRTANTTTAPDGNTTADTLTASVGSTTHGFYRPQTYIAADYTLSIYAKAGTYSFLTLDFTNNTGDGATFNLSTGAIGFTNASVTSSITSVGNGWYRCVITKTMTALSGFPEFYLSSSGTANGRIFNAAGTETVFLWGAQLEQRSAVTAYTATTTQAITNYIPKLQSAASGVARFDNNPTTGESLGLLIEEQRTNLLTYSADITNADWGSSVAGTAASNVLIAPDGTLSADSYVEDSTTGLHAKEFPSFTYVTSTVYTLSIYAKAKGNRWIELGFPATVFTARFGKFDLVNGVVGSSDVGITSTITNVGNGWYRCTISTTCASGSSARAAVFLNTSSGTRNYLGDGWSGAYLWGAQLEAGTFATSYIPTVASQVTRSADAASMTGTNFSSWFNAGQGSFIINAARAAIQDSSGAGGYGRVLGNDAGTNSFLEYEPTTNKLSVSGAGPYSFTVSGLSTAASVFNNMAVAYDSSGISVTANNAAVQASSSSARMATSSRLVIFGTGSGSYSSSGWVKKVAYYPIKVTSTNMQALTS